MPFKGYKGVWDTPWTKKIPTNNRYTDIHQDGITWYFSIPVVHLIQFLMLMVLSEIQTAPNKVSSNRGLSASEVCRVYKLPGCSLNDGMISLSEVLQDLRFTVCGLLFPFLSIWYTKQMIVHSKKFTNAPDCTAAEFKKQWTRVLNTTLDWVQVTLDSWIKHECRLSVQRVTPHS